LSRLVGLWCNLGAGRVVVSGAGLLPPTAAATARIRTSGHTVQDGLFANLKEHLGRFFIIEVPDLEATLDWAAKAPSSASASTEVRPVLAIPG
jgi:hypothetical protein